MQGNFSYYNPTKLYFGDESLNFLKDELKNFGPVVLLNYGSGSVKRNGIYDQVVAILREAGKTIVENPGVMTNPTLEKLREGIKIARENNVDLILALGGGSVCDYSKAVAASVFYDGDYWDKFWLRQEQPDADQKLLPVGCILTMAGTGSEMNAGTVITDKLKNMQDYDVVYVGFPIWWYTAPTIINTFMEAYDFKGKTVIPFATSGGSSIKKACEDLKAAYPDVNWKEGKLLNRASKQELETWVKGL